MDQLSLPEPLNLESIVHGESGNSDSKFLHLPAASMGKMWKFKQQPFYTEALETYNTFTWETPSDEKNVDNILGKLKNTLFHKNVTWQTHIFNTHNQRSDEIFDQYIADLKTKVKTYQFGGDQKEWLEYQQGIQALSIDLVHTTQIAYCNQHSS